MELRDYLAVLRRSWLLITATTLLGALVAGGLSMLMTPVYQASTQLFISMSEESGDGASSAYTGALFAQQRVKSYTAIVDSPAVLEPVIDELDLQTTPTALAARVNAVAPTNTVLINVTATDTDPATAALIANAVGDSFADEIVRLETPSGSDASPVKPSVTKPAVEPRAPISPRTQLNVLLGALLGLMLGVGIAILRRVSDTTVASPEELTEAADATLLGVIGFDSQAKSSPLVALDQTSVRSEAFRSIRTNLQYVDVDNPPRCVVITSAVPGEGKSTAACNLAITLAQAGSRVLLVEADLRRPRVADYLGVDGSVGLTDVMIGKRRLDEVIIPWNRGLFDLLPSGPIPPNPSELLGSHQMVATLAELATRYDAILLDAPPLLPVTDAAVLTSLADGAVLVCRHGSTRREQVTQATDAIRQVGGRLLGTVLNFAPTKGRSSGNGYGYGHGYGYGYSYGDKEPTRGRLSVEDMEAARAESQLGGQEPAGPTTVQTVAPPPGPTAGWAPLAHRSTPTSTGDGAAGGPTSPGVT